MHTLLSRFSNKRVLILEWKTMLTNEVRKCLEELGTEIIGPIGNLREAKNAISAGKPDAAIVDLDMPADTAVWLDDLLMQSDIPYVFAQGSEQPRHGDAGFHLVSDPEQLAAIAAALFPMTALH
jgi:DNA-binding NarL/FixJ family response regulator